MYVATNSEYDCLFVDDKESHELGKNAAILLACLLRIRDDILSRFENVKKQEKNNKEIKMIEFGWFPISVTDVEELIGMKCKQQIKNIDKLGWAKRLMILKDGIPLTRYFMFYEKE